MAAGLNGEDQLVIAWSGQAGNAREHTRVDRCWRPRHRTMAKRAVLGERHAHRISRISEMVWVRGGAAILRVMTREAIRRDCGVSARVLPHMALAALDERVHAG